MIAKFGVVFPSTSFVALKLGGVFSNTVHFSEGSFVHGLKGLVNLRSFVSTFARILFSAFQTKYSEMVWVVSRRVY